MKTSSTVLREKGRRARSAAYCCRLLPVSVNTGSFGIVRYILDAPVTGLRTGGRYDGRWTDASTLDRKNNFGSSAE